MPRILINEKDRTSPGTPGSYANYSVLIPGFMNREPVLAVDATKEKPADKIQPDSNGVYEFSSAQDFKDTIGLIDKKTVNGADEYHYGNKMAYKLLDMGYTVIYKPIDFILTQKDSEGEITKLGLDHEDFWEDFKDKASYDFRFVSHGLLESNLPDNKVADYEGYVERLRIVKEDAAKFAEITAEEYPNYIKDLAGVDADGNSKLICKEDGTLYFTDSAGLQYGTYAEAKAELGKGIDGTIKAISDLEDAIATCSGSYVTTGVINNINGIIAKLASYRTDDKGVVFCGGRGDCTALIELDEKCYVKTSSTVRPENLIINGIKGLSSFIGAEGEYCALTAPSVHYYVDDTTTYKMPGAFHYLTCFMNSISSGFAEWYAAAGYTRGVSSYVIDHTSVKLGEIAINALEPRRLVTNGPKFACNVIANFRGSYYLWGNRTAAQLTENDLTAKHFLNIRQLCSTLKKQLYVACRRFTFDPNSDTLWFNFVNAITPTLDAMKADQGVRDYKILKVFTDKKATLKAKIRIIPIEAVEDFDIEVSLEDSFGGVSVNAN